MMEDCKSQIVRNLPGARNFHFTAILVVVALGCVIIGMGLTIDTVVGFSQKKLRLGEEHRSRWVLDSVFQLQRMAFEGLGVEGWQKIDSSVPTTEEQRFPRIGLGSGDLRQTEPLSTKVLLPGARHPRTLVLLDGVGSVRMTRRFSCRRGC